MTEIIPAGLTAADELQHPVGEGEWWGESWYFDFATRDASLGGYVRLGLYPNRQIAWYWACVVGEGRPLVTVVDHEVRPPRPPSLEVRAEGLWADHTIATPFEHVTLGCEAFALGLDDPAAMYDAPVGAVVGDRVPFGLDLEWETDGTVYAYPPGTTRYEVPCRVHGIVLVGDERIELDAIGERDHSWGPRDWWVLGWTWSAGWLEDGTRFHGTTVRHGDEVLPYHPGFVRPPGGPLSGVERTAAGHVPGDHGFPVSATLGYDDLELRAEPVAFAPVLLQDGAGRVSRFPRALCRFHDPATGRAGAGWVEWNQPQS